MNGLLDAEDGGRWAGPNLKYPAIKLYPLNFWGTDGKICLVYSLMAHISDSDGE